MAELTEDLAPDELGPVWTRALAGLADGTLSPQHRAFLRLTRPVAVVGDTVLIAAPNDFARDVIENRLRTVLTDALSGELGS
ncbi:MAG: chromosomal replication initiator protein DnaA, partial [Oryzihumus sp.]